jgi:hypothetical protein
LLIALLIPFKTVYFPLATAIVLLVVVVVVICGHMRRIAIGPNLTTILPSHYCQQQQQQQCQKVGRFPGAGDWGGGGGGGWL